jgi:protein-S-isoprenylcysteine O-methyltransferase Ste14
MSEPAPESKRDNAGVKVPPPLIYIGTLAAALVIDLVLGGPTFSGLGVPGIVRIASGVALFLAGMFVAGAGVARFRDARTEIRPWLASTALVTTGIYRFTRNPMYLGLTLSYAGLSLLADSVLALACLIPLLVVIIYAVIRREEHYLEVTFGEEYRAYKRKVRRWL